MEERLRSEDGNAEDGALGTIGQTAAFHFHGGIRNVRQTDGWWPLSEQKQLDAVMFGYFFGATLKAALGDNDPARLAGNIIENCAERQNCFLLYCLVPVSGLDDSQVLNACNGEFPKYINLMPSALPSDFRIVFHLDRTSCFAVEDLLKDALHREFIRD